MTEPDFGNALAAAAGETLETMFFAPADAENPGSENWPDAPIAARVEFAGARSGRLTVRVPAQTARALAADFLGEEEGAMEERQAGEVVCELANMICGSALSRAASRGEFRLFAPSLGGFDDRYPPEAVRHSAATGYGPVEAILELDPCATAEE